MNIEWDSNGRHRIVNPPVQLLSGEKAYTCPIILPDTRHEPAVRHQLFPSAIHVGHSKLNTGSSVFFPFTRQRRLRGRRYANFGWMPAAITYSFVLLGIYTLTLYCTLWTVSSRWGIHTVQVHWVETELIVHLPNRNGTSTVPRATHSQI